MFLIVGQSENRMGRSFSPLTSCAVAILDAGRNALSFFLLLIVSLGLSVVKESLGRIMLRCQILAVAHFIFGGVSNTRHSLRTYKLTHPPLSPLRRWHRRVGT